MMIAVLCQVVGHVAEIEQEAADLALFTERLELLSKISRDSNRRINKSAFLTLVQEREACTALDSVGIDPLHLLESADHIFDNETKALVGITFRTLVENIMEFHLTKKAT